MGKRMCPKVSISYQNSYVRKILHSAANHPFPPSPTLNTQAWLSCKQSANLVALMQLMEKSLRKTQWPCLACFLKARWGHCHAANSPGRASEILSFLHISYFPDYLLHALPTHFQRHRFILDLISTQLISECSFPSDFWTIFFSWIDLCFTWIVLPFWWRGDFYLCSPSI